MAGLCSWQLWKSKLSRMEHGELGVSTCTNGVCSLMVTDYVNEGDKEEEGRDGLAIETGVRYARPQCIAEFHSSIDERKELSD